MKANKIRRNLKMSYNRSLILKRAWKMFKENDNVLTFSDCLRKSWYIAKNGSFNNTFAEIYNNHNKAIYRYILYKVKNVQIAEELTQDVFRKVFLHLQEYDVYKAKLNTWLYTIANNCILDNYRLDKSSRYTNIADFIDTETGKEMFQFVDNDSEADNDINNSEKRIKITNAFNKLKPNYRKIAELYFIEEKQYLEIAEICNVPMGTVKGMLNRIRIKLQSELSDIYSTKQAINSIQG